MEKTEIRWDIWERRLIANALLVAQARAIETINTQYRREMCLESPAARARLGELEREMKPVLQ